MLNLGLVKPADIVKPLEVVGSASRLSAVLASNVGYLAALLRSVVDRLQYTDLRLLDFPGRKSARLADFTYNQSESEDWNILAFLSTAGVSRVLDAMLQMKQDSKLLVQLAESAALLAEVSTHAVVRPGFDFVAGQKQLDAYFRECVVGNQSLSKDAFRIWQLSQAGRPVQTPLVKLSKQVGSKSNLISTSSLPQPVASTPSRVAAVVPVVRAVAARWRSSDRLGPSCYEFNFGWECAGSPAHLAKFAHRCAVCGADHPRTACPVCVFFFEVCFPSGFSARDPTD